MKFSGQSREGQQAPVGRRGTQAAGEVARPAKSDAALFVATGVLGVLVAQFFLVAALRSAADRRALGL